MHFDHIYTLNTRVNVISTNLNQKNKEIIISDLGLTCESSNSTNAWNPF